jgi:hypothetical protein
MKKLTLSLCVLLTAGMLFAGVSQSIGLGVGLDAYSMETKDDGNSFSTNAFGISVTGMTTFDKVEHLMVYENIDLGFPRTIKSGGVSTSFDSGTLLGLTIGAGYTSSFKKSPVSYSIGAGGGWQKLTVTESSATVGYSCFTLSVFGNVRYDIKDGWFADFTMLDTMGFSTKAKAGSIETDYMKCFMNNAIVKIGGGYSFSF